MKMKIQIQNTKYKVQSKRSPEVQRDLQAANQTQEPMPPPETDEQMYLSKLLNVVVQIVKCICQNC